MFVSREHDKAEFYNHAVLYFCTDRRPGLRSPVTMQQCKLSCKSRINSQISYWDFN